MATINFKEEVLKVYPDAVCKRSKLWNGYFANQIYTNYSSKKRTFLEEGNNENAAWQNAYNNILNQKQ